MIAPYVIAIVFGLTISAGLYFIFVWPRREPPDEDSADSPEDRRSETQTKAF